MLQAVALAVVALMTPQANAEPARSVLHVSVVLAETDGRPTPVPRHTLLISDNPSTELPKVVVTGSDGSADVALRPGNYTVESERPVPFRGKAYRWTQLVDIKAGQDASLVLNAGNAETAPISSTNVGGEEKSDPWLSLSQWQDSVATLWTPDNRASAFLVDARGLLVTTQFAVGLVTSAEVQLTPAIKVQGQVAAADPVRGVAVLWVNPAAVSAIRPVPLGCAQASGRAPREGQEIFTVVAPPGRQKDVIPGAVTRVTRGAVLSDLPPEAENAGGPVFTPDGALMGLTSFARTEDDSTPNDVRIIAASEACAVLSTAEKTITGEPPSASQLPVEPDRPFPVDSLKPIVERRVGSLSPYQISSNEFDLAFITPVHVYGAKHFHEQSSGAGTAGARTPVPSLMDFGNWSRYVDAMPPVLLVRVRPKLGEGFWTKVARGAARTQGVAIPPLKRFKSSFARLRAFCGTQEITPIHPLRIAQRLSSTSTIYEGLYVYDPGALTSRCGRVTLTIYSEDQADRGDTRAVDPAVLQQIWQDFESYRTLRP